MTQNYRGAFAGAALMLGLLAAGAPAVADDGASYEITIINLTKGQVLTPALLVTHDARYKLFNIGDTASAGLATLAETGNPADARAEAASAAGVYRNDVDAAGVIPPGMRHTVTIQARGNYNRLTVAGMLASTNDTFYGIDGAMLPSRGAMTLYANAYDAGSEVNNERCRYVPGPPCSMASGNSRAPKDVGFVHMSNGIHGVGDLKPALLDWRGPVAMIQVRRVH